MKILVIDDELVSRKKMHKIMEQAGECESYETGSHALKAFKDAMVADVPFDLISLDIVMPDMSGIEVLTQISDEDQGKGALQINVSQDKLRAYLTLTSPGNGFTLGDVKNALAAQNIISGVVEDKHIESFIKDWAGSDKRFKVAEGVYPVQGENGYIRFLFDVDHLKAGTAREGGGMDYKDRGGDSPCKKRRSPGGEDTHEAGHGRNGCVRPYDRCGGSVGYRYYRR